VSDPATKRGSRLVRPNPAPGEKWRSFSRALRYLRPYRRLAVGSTALLLFSSALGLLTPWPLKILIDNVLQQHPLPGALTALLGGLAANRSLLLVVAVSTGLVLTIITNLATVLHKHVDTTIQESVQLDFRSELFQHAQKLSLAFHDRRRSGRLILAITNQGGALTSVMMSIPPLVQGVITLVGMFCVIFAINSTLALLSLIVVPGIYYSITYYMRNIQPRLRRVKKMEAESLSIVHEAISMLRVIVAFGRESYEFERFRRQGNAALGERVSVTVRQTGFSLVVNSMTAAGTALVLGFGAHAVLEGQLTVGQLLVVMSYLGMVYKPLEQISGTLTSLQEKFVGLELSFRLLDEIPEIQDRPGARSISGSTGHLVFEDVSFSYQNRRQTLQHISLEAKGGQLIALVGPTGAGKTTLLSLVPRFYDPVEGRILLDGIDIRELTLESLRAQISLVLQEPLLFAGSLAENIRYGRLDATQEEIEEAARRANAHDFVMALPEQYETVIGERGSQLSGGERQRISIARAFLKNAPILLLDEPTSSIDSKTEAVILDALTRLMAGRTTFMAAHRLSTIQRADLILVLNRGKAIQQGTHQELMETPGLYRRLQRMQRGSRGQGKRAGARRLQAVDSAAVDAADAIEAVEGVEGVEERAAPSTRHS
jgi:ABC-type multidrug transport system fused ATPase/permease subunit